MYRDANEALSAFRAEIYDPDGVVKDNVLGAVMCVLSAYQHGVHGTCIEMARGMPGLRDALAWTTWCDRLLAGESRRSTGSPSKTDVRVSDCLARMQEAHREGVRFSDAVFALGNLARDGKQVTIDQVLAAVFPVSAGLHVDVQRRQWSSPDGWGIRLMDWGLRWNVLPIPGQGNTLAAHPRGATLDPVVLGRWLDGHRGNRIPQARAFRRLYEDRNFTGVPLGEMTKIGVICGPNRTHAPHVRVTRYGAQISHAFGTVCVQGQPCHEAYNHRHGRIGIAINIDHLPDEVLATFLFPAFPSGPVPLSAWKSASVVTHASGAPVTSETDARDIRLGVSCVDVGDFPPPDATSLDEVLAAMECKNPRCGLCAGTGRVAVPSWFADRVPCYYNNPASTWIQDAKEREQHARDRIMLSRRNR